MTNKLKYKGISSNKPLDNFFTFLNESLKNVEESQFYSLTLAYTRFLAHGQSRHELIDFQVKYKELMEGVAEAAGPSEILDERKAFLAEIQSFLRSLMDDLIEAGKQGKIQTWNQEPLIKGEITFDYDADGDRLIQTVIPKGLKKAGALELGNEKKLAKLALADLIQEHDLSISRFTKCPWCGNYFYKSGKKKFCSSRCSNANRQKQFRDKN